MRSALEGRRVRIWTFGCRTNQYEGEALAAAFEGAGAHLVEDAPYDVAIVVSCSVTAEADRKARQILRRARRAAENAVVVLCGCVAEAQIAQGHVLPGVDLLVGNRKKSEIPSLIERFFERCLPVPACVPGDVRGALWDALELPRPVRRTRAFLKVQEGCDRFCSYCIVPFVRGCPVSRPADDVLCEAARIAESGCREIVLTGVHLGLYGRDEKTSLGNLVRCIGRLPGIGRIRFGSIEPFALDEMLLGALAEVPQFCPHFHMPLQSGDDAVLSAMRRGYSAREFAAAVERVRRFFGDDVHCGTDLLVGFPGEDEASFERTLAYVRALRLGRLHVFPYSPRPGTVAASLPGRVPRGIAAERCRRGIALSAELLREYALRFVGRTLPVLVEEVSGSGVEGFSPHFLRVRSSGSAVQGDEVSVRIDASLDGELEGVVEVRGA